MTYTGTFLGGPYDGEVMWSDINPVIVEEPINEDKLVGGFKALPELPSLSKYTPLIGRLRLYMFYTDDDMRGWWVPYSH